MGRKDDQLDVFPTRIVLMKPAADGAARRVYRISVQSDLFGRARLICEWGRDGRGLQRSVEHHDDEGRAISALMQRVAEKRRDGFLQDLTRGTESE
ncbi:WGR domain-containing protein [Pseudoprimorskyibacter insulae]|uniref:WGR domain-containing protein n=1 Tax=Pseudoprimorskyibacter insulae TaxID=1695997 RepID=A0A2R8B0K9_9RHOB|nr:WGR domain-containing protein [Pseudoprimorskyibacter insulae]SPF81649.1 hypothetical protein PRI8871_03474 [Pseudoprimorskyibacter insulae]